MRRNDDELFAATACNEVGLPQRAFDDGRKLDQGLVARLVAQGVVDGLEVIDVEKHRRKRRAIALGANHFLREPLVEVAPIEKRGQRIGDRFLLEAGNAPDIVGGLKSQPCREPDEASAEKEDNGNHDFADAALAGSHAANKLRLWFDADQVEALSADRAALWERVARADFLTVNEKRAAVGYEPMEEGEG